MEDFGIGFLFGIGFTILGMISFDLYQDRMIRKEIFLDEQ